MPPTPSRAIRHTVPIARPANPALSALSTAGDDEPTPEPWFTPVTLKGWTTSLSLHGVILLVMALWYFSPKAPPQVFDTRLVGSEMGVDEGMSATGGMNTPIELASATPPLTGPDASVFKPLEIEELAPSLAGLADVSKPSAGGGIANLNPGAGNGDGFGLARFGEGGENIRGVEVKVGDPQFTLLWDSEADLDLHVIEPGGQEIFWETPKGKFGGELDVDNTKGFGPENVYWLKDDEAGGGKVKGPGPPGEYRWFVVYYGGFGGAPKPTRWKVRIKHAGKVSVATGRFKALNEHSRTYTLKVDTPANDPGVATAP